MITATNCVDGSGNGTKATMPARIWNYSVELTAIRHGASLVGIDASRHKLAPWFNAGEPVWMAADSLLQLARGYDRCQREHADGFSTLRKAASR